jgi:chromosome segregation ATPase
MATARDRALNLNVPLRAQIAELKKNLVTEAEALKSSQDGRDQDRAKHMQKLAKKEGEITGLLHQAKKTASDSDQFKKSQQKKAEQLMADLSATQSALALKTTELESTVFDADRVQSELEQVREQVREQSKQLDTGRAEREAVVANLRKQLEEAKSRLLSSRTNQQVEEDHIRKAVQGATATRDERIKLLEKELQDLKNEKSVSEQVRKSDEKNIRELFQDKYALKEKNDELEEKFANVAAVHEALEQEIAEGQAKIKLLEDQLSSSRAAIERVSNLA